VCHTDYARTARQKEMDIVLYPSGGDDTSALAASLSPPNSSVTLGGMLKVSSTVTPTNGCSITATNGGGILWTGATNTGSTYAIKFSGTTLAVDGVIFNGAGLNLDGSTGANVQACTIENIPGRTPFGVYFGSIANARINLNTFRNIAAVGAIMGYNAQDSSFSGNTFIDCYERGKGEAHQQFYAVCERPE
jgi:hypothetical protein